MADLTFQQAIDQLNAPEHLGRYSSFDGLMELTRQVSIADPAGTAANARTFTYGGMISDPTIGDIGAAELADVVQKAEGLNGRIIKNTDAGKLLLRLHYDLVSVLRMRSER